MYTYYQGVPNISALIAFKSSVPDVDTVNESKRVSVLNTGGGGSTAVRLLSTSLSEMYFCFLGRNCGRLALKAMLIDVKCSDLQMHCF